MQHFEDSLSFCSPAHGGWGLVRVAALVPESYLLFVCAAACFRHGALGAIQHGIKDQVSYLYLEKSDIVSGYDQLILDGIDELLERLPKKIRLLYVYVSCLDDFIGTDLEAVLAKAGRKHPEVCFVAGHMNPIAMSTKLPPMVTTMRAMQEPMPVWEQRDRGVSLFGNYVALPEDAELLRVLRKRGFAVRQTGSCRDFDEYLTMSKSEFCLLLKPYGKLELETLKKRSGQRSADVFVSYDLETADHQYAVISELLGEDLAGDPLVQSAREEAVRSVRETLETVGELPVFLSDSATLFPFLTAKALKKYGFRVERIYAQQVAGPDERAFYEVKETMPEIRIIQSDHPRRFRYTPQETEALAIGEEGGYLSGSCHVADLTDDEGMFGYYGISRLMKLMKEAVREKTDLKKIIEEYGGII